MTSSGVWRLLWPYRPSSTGLFITDTHTTAVTHTLSTSCHTAVTTECVWPTIFLRGSSGRLELVNRQLACSWHWQKQLQMSNKEIPIYNEHTVSPMIHNKNRRFPSLLTHRRNSNDTDRLYSSIINKWTTTRVCQTLSVCLRTNLQRIYYVAVRDTETSCNQPTTTFDILHVQSPTIILHTTQ